SGTSLFATAPMPSFLRISSMSCPRFLRVNFSLLFRASALMISPETKTGIPWAFITLEARLFPAPGIPTITITVFLSFPDCKGGSWTVGNVAVIALKQEHCERQKHCQAVKFGASYLLISKMSRFCPRSGPSCYPFQRESENANPSHA